jgi:hypothetical protein
MAKIITKEYDEVLLEIAAKITRSCESAWSDGRVQMSMMDAYDIREAVRVLKALRHKVKELEGNK